MTYPEIRESVAKLWAKLWPDSLPVGIGDARCFIFAATQAEHRLQLARSY